MSDDMPAAGRLPKVRRSKQPIEAAEAFTTPLTQVRKNKEAQYIRENVLTSDLVRHVKLVVPGAVVFKHTDAMTAGVPDISITYNGITLWLEGKVSRGGGKPEGTGVQLLTMQRLFNHGRAAYVVWWQRDSERRTYILTPRQFGAWELGDEFAGGWRHDYVVRYLRSKLPFGAK